MEIDMQIFNASLWGNSVDRWLTSLIIIFTLLIGLRLLEAITARRYSKMDKTTQDGFYGLIAKLIKRTSTLVIAIASIHVGTQILKLPETADVWISATVVIALIIQIALWGDELIDFALQHYQAKLNFADQGERMTTLRALAFLGRLVLIIVAALLALDNIPGVKITTLVASLGIGGIAVAVAMQNILADLFASLSIVMDKPFVIGDFIVVDTYFGTVEHIGLKTTRVRSLSGEQMIFSNSDLLKSRIRNYKSMSERRVVFTVGVVYQISHEKLRRIPAMIRAIIEESDKVRFDRAHFQGFSDSALIFEAVYYVLAADYNAYMDIQQHINFAIFKTFENENISFAYPTRTVHFPEPCTSGPKPAS
ncbi:MAG: hypothetical protein VR64_01315 [Desulfatitalea sp. BRH_c12]|nr:MAG: hypothetical protein VR64_01315 [Desulfatitalea sp. BRH_c12]